jgi:CheY-like chemotaxis protein
VTASPRAPLAGSADDAPRLLSEGPIADLMRAGSFEAALTRLNEARDAAPRDAAIAEAIRRVREASLVSGVARLGGLEAVPVRTGVALALGADERYLIGLVTGAAALDELLAASTLGRYRTVRGLCGLLELGVIQTQARSWVSDSPVAPASAVRTVVVADGHPSSAAITRTMLRLVLGATAQLETVTSVAQLVSMGAKQRPDLVVTELVLADGEALPAVRTLRKSLGQLIPLILIASRTELEVASGRAPDRSVVLARPIEKTALIEALATIAFARKT